MPALVSRRLSKIEVLDRVLDMGKTGVYRESILEALYPLATKRDIRAAIAQAKHFGLHSVAHLRDADLGTYYELDLAKYTASQTALEHLRSTTSIDLSQQLIEAKQAIQRMLWIAYGMGGLLILAALAIAQMGDWQISVALISGGGSAIAVGVMQQSLSQRR